MKEIEADPYCDCHVTGLKLIADARNVGVRAGLQPKKNRTLPQSSNLGLVFFDFFRFFSVFFGFSILANFDWFNGFLLSGSFW